LTDAHGGLPAGTRLLVGFAAADRAWAAPPPLAPGTPEQTTPATTTHATTTVATTTAIAPTPTSTPKKQTSHPAAHGPKSTHAAAPAKKKKKAGSRSPAAGEPLQVRPDLWAGTYEFPVAGAVSWGDTYGGSRSDVPGGWHHGDDLFAELGAPVLAVTDGTVFAVGWNRVGGWRLWLADDHGNAFYYAHLSGYTALAKNNHRVRRGQVLAYVGNTGDAFTTSDHLHFEVHPNGLLYLGYDGAVDPTTYLRAWQQPARIDPLPPVALPDGPVSGFGVAANYRQLLQLRAPKQKAAKPKAEAPERAPAATTGAGSAPVVRVSAGETGAGPDARATAIRVGVTLAVLAGLFAALGGLGWAAVRRRAAR
jgi:murein DD-endopeptidase MepM/ murein hydrolase activator NlpD